MELYRYVNPQFRRSDYNGVMIDPVVLFQPPEIREDGTQLTAEAIYGVRRAIDNALRGAVDSRFRRVQNPGAGIARVSLTILGMSIEPEALKPYNAIPISAVITLAGRATGYDPKRAILVVEAKVQDSETGRLLGAAVHTLQSDVFRDRASSVEAFEALAVRWAETAVRLADEALPPAP